MTTGDSDNSELTPPPPPPPPPAPSSAAAPPAPTSYGAATVGAVPATNGLATAGLILGIVSIFLNTFFVVSIAGIVVSALGIKRAGDQAKAGLVPVGKTAAIWGLVLAILGAINSLAWKWLFLFFF